MSTLGRQVQGVIGLCGVAIMAKASIAGTVKTRLVPPLTYEEAAEFNTCCLADIAATVANAARQAPIQGFAAYHPLGAEAFFNDLLPDGFKLLPPKAPTIGRSLFHAAQDLFDAGYGSVCLVNADSPTLPVEIFVETVHRLQQAGDRVVIGPATDGGYYLIGLKQFHRRLFAEIDWSTDRVYRQTVARAGEIGLAIAALPEWYDVDDEESLAALGYDLLTRPTIARYCPAPATTAFLEKLAATKLGISRLFERGRSFPPPSPLEEKG